MTTRTTHPDATIHFLSSSRNKIQAPETLVVVNLKGRVAALHIGANHLPYSEEKDEGSGGPILLSEIKKI